MTSDDILTAYAKADTIAFMLWCSIVRKLKDDRMYDPHDEFPYLQTACSAAVLAESLKRAYHEEA